MYIILIAIIVLLIYIIADTFLTKIFMIGNITGISWNKGFKWFIILLIINISIIIFIPIYYYYHDDIGSIGPIGNNGNKGIYGANNNNCEDCSKNI